MVSKYSVNFNRPPVTLAAQSRYLLGFNDLGDEGHERRREERCEAFPSIARSARVFIALGQHRHRGPRQRIAVALEEPLVIKE
jgi:hypothetical protein